MEQKRLYKSRHDRKLFGVCGGIAEFFGLDSTLIRVGWVIAALAFGSGILAYIIVACIMPSPPVL